MFFLQILITCSILLLAAACGMPIGYSAVLLPQLYNDTEPLVIDIEMGSWIGELMGSVRKAETYKTKVTKG